MRRRSARTSPALLLPLVLLLVVAAACTELRRGERPPMDPLSSGTARQSGNRP